MLMQCEMWMIVYINMHAIARQFLKTEPRAVLLGSEKNRVQQTLIQ